MRKSPFVVAFAYVASFAGSALADSPVDRPEKSGGSSGEAAEPDASRRTGSPSPARGGAGEREEREEPTTLAVDVAVGVHGEVPALNPRLPTSFATTEVNGADQTPAVSDSYIFSGDHSFGMFRVGARVPLAHATLSPNRADTSARTRGRAVLGDLELFARGDILLSKTLHLRPRLGLALPTAPGLPLPKNGEIAANPAKVYEPNTFDEYSVLQAAAGSRGFEENALFASRRLGIIPELALEARVDKLELEPFVKLENLVSVSNELTEAYEGGLVYGLSLGYPLTEHFGFGARIFGAYEFESRVAGGHSLEVIEPQLRAHFGPSALALGVLIPFYPVRGKNEDPAAHPDESASVTLNDPRFVTIRLAASVGF